MFRVVGTVAILCAVLGLLYNASSAYAVLAGALNDSTSESPYLLPAFWSMSAIYVAFYVVLLVCGVQFLRLSASLWPLFIVALAMEVAMHFVVGALWVHPTYGLGIAGATGISGGGVMFQYFILFPLWAPAAILAARKSVTHVDL